MTPLDVAAILIVLAAVFGYVNYRIIGLPHTMGLTVMGAVASIAVVALDAALPGLGLGHGVRVFFAGIDFRTALMDGMLAFLLFAGALHVDLSLILRRKWTILSLATIGVLISTVMIGFGFKGMSLLLGLDVPILWCLVFGALISPTDPVAVLGILKSAKVPASLEAKVAGESLFNDGVGVVVFSILLAAALGAGEFSLVHAAELFLLEAVGGAVFGLAIGWLGFVAMRGIDEHNLEVLITMAMVMGGYALAQAIHVSGPVAMAVAGLLIGNHGVSLAMSERTRAHVLQFWSLVDEMLNSVLFLLIGLEVLVVGVSVELAMIAAVAIPIVLAARLISVAVPISLLSLRQTYSRGAIAILTWGGLRGGISVALALSLPATAYKPAILAATYAVVVFSIIVQGLTMKAVVKGLGGPLDAGDE